MISLRRTAVAVLAGAGLIAPGSAHAAGGTYVVVQCAAQNRSDEAETRQPRAYDLHRRCTRGPDYSMRIDSLLRARTGARGEYTWTAPPKTGFVRARVEAKLRRHVGHRAHLVMADADGNDTHRVGTGDTAARPFKNWKWNGPRQAKFVARLKCWRTGGCDQSNAAKTWVRRVRLTLTDLSDPVVSASGSLLGGGWLRGNRELRAALLDSGSGLTEASMRVNGVALEALDLDCARAPTSGAAIALVPCPRAADLGQLVASTSTNPFRDGQNLVSICARDFAGNESCDTHTLSVDNAPPEVAFAASELPDDPELIRAPVADPHSGLASGRILLRASGEELWQPLPTQLAEGELRTRVDSAAYPAGPYELKAEATDAAGNRAETVRREDGSPMIVSFPLRSGVDLSGRIEPGGQRRVTLGYGRPRRAVGRLRGRDGTPLAGREVRVEEYFGSGALIDRRIRTVSTDERGRWSSRLPPGPSRRVVAHYEGDARYLDGEARAGRLVVRSKAQFRTSRGRVPEGRRILFSGRVARLGARIPSGGKLLELQVREGPGRWSTVREAFRSGSHGSYRVRYRFGRFYLRNARFRFRVKVAREADWPYRQATSRARTVTVLAR